MIQATYRQHTKQYQTPQWERGYGYVNDPFGHETKKAEKLDRVRFYHGDLIGTPKKCQIKQVKSFGRRNIRLRMSEER